MDKQPPAEWSAKMRALQKEMGEKHGDMARELIILYATSIFTRSFHDGNEAADALANIIETYFEQFIPRLLPNGKEEVVASIEKLVRFFIESRYPESKVEFIRNYEGGFDFKFEVANPPPGEPIH